MRRALSFAVVALAAAGCSILNQPDPVPAPRTDAGPFDGGPDTGGDAGVDALSNYDGCTPLTTTETICDNGMDEDCNSLVDCADFGCAGTEGCCDPSIGEDLIPTESWTSPVSWISLPRGATSGPGTLSGHVTFRDDWPSAFLYNTCSPLLLGATFLVNFRIDPAATCTEGDPADCYASAVFTLANDLIQENSLPDDIRVTVTGDGQLQVTRPGGVIDGTWTGMVGAADVMVNIEIVPGLNARGTPVLLATVRVGTDVVAANVPFLLQANASDDCDGGSGLYFAVEGLGPQVQVGRVTGRSQGCANPSHFQPIAAADVTATEMGLDDMWTSGGISAPALGSYTTGPDAPIEVLVDGSNAQRTDELWQHVGFAIGGARTSRDFAAGTFSARGPAGRAGEPVIGAFPPQVMKGETVPISTREPTLYVPVNWTTGAISSASMVGGFASEITAGSDIFGISRFLLGPTDLFAAPALSAPIMPAEPCVSMRDPLILPRGAEAADGFWLFYTCEQALPAAPLIQVLALDLGLTPTGGSPVDVITPALEPILAASGAFAPEGMARYDTATGQMSYRLWFLGTDARGATTILMAQSDGPAGAEQLRPFIPYPGNPVLTSGDRVLGDCSGICLIEGLGATLRGGRGQDVRMLVARSVNEPSGTRHELVPLQQFWR